MDDISLDVTLTIKINKKQLQKVISDVLFSYHLGRESSEDAIIVADEMPRIDDILETLTGGEYTSDLRQWKIRR